MVERPLRQQTERQSNTIFTHCKVDPLTPLHTYTVHTHASTSHRIAIKRQALALIRTYLGSLLKISHNYKQAHTRHRCGESICGPRWLQGPPT